jgi:hypothetical protein
MHRAAAARAGDVLGLDHHLDPRQAVRQRSAAGPPLLGTGALQRRIRFLLFGLAGGDRLFEILQPQIELVGVKLLGALAKLHPLKLADEVAQPIVLLGEPVALSDEPHLLGTFGVALDPRFQDQRAEHGNIVGKGFGGRAHHRD